MPNFIGLLTRKTTLAALTATTLGSVAISGVGYNSLGDEVTLTVDGDTHEIRTMDATVGEVLQDFGIEVGKNDVVAPGVDTPVTDGLRISVLVDRPALNTASYRLVSASRGGDRTFSLGDVVAKQVTVTAGRNAPQQDTVHGFTVQHALTEMGVSVDGDDRVAPALSSQVSDGDKITVTRITVVQKRIENEKVPFKTVVRKSNDLYNDQQRVDAKGKVGLRDVTYERTYRNGTMAKQSVLEAEVTRKAKPRIVVVGTKARPVPDGATWDRLAQCESGGNWSINTGNGYYGGLQFNLQTWQAYGGSGYPHQNSRAEQIRVATKLRDARGGYGAWPSCSAKLGLPR